MGVNFKKKSGTSNVVVEEKGVEVLNESENVPTQVLESEQHATVSVSMGCTVNIGNYSNVKMHVGLTLPCSDDLNKIDTAFNDAHTWVEGKLEEVHDKMLGESEEAKD